MFENPRVSAKPEEQVHTHLQRGAWDFRNSLLREKNPKKGSFGARRRSTVFASITVQDKPPLKWYVTLRVAWKLESSKRKESRKHWGKNSLNEMVAFNGKKAKWKTHVVQLHSFRQLVTKARQFLLEITTVFAPSRPFGVGGAVNDGVLPPAF